MTRNQLTQLCDHIALEHNKKNPVFVGLFDPPASVGKIHVPIVRCAAEPKSSFKCVIANMIDKFKKTLPKELGEILENGISVSRGRIYIACWVLDHNDRRTNAYRVFRFDHNGNWIIEAFDRKNDALIRAMWAKVDSGVVVTMKRFRESQTLEARKNKIVKPKVTSVPNRGTREGGIRPNERRLEAERILNLKMAKKAARELRSAA